MAGDDVAAEGRELEVEHRDGVAVLTLNRPDRLNALNLALIERLLAEVAEADRSPTTRVVVIRGAGRAFCGGYDLKAAVAGTDDTYGTGGEDVLAEFRNIRATNHRLRPLWESSIPIIAAVHGHCVAGGMELMLHADMVVCARSARIGFPPARSQGTPPSSLLLNRLGLQWTKRLLFTGDVLSGDTAARIGLALEAVDDDELDDRALELAGRIALIDKDLLAANKLSVNLAAAVANQGLANDVTALVDAATKTLPAVQSFRSDAFELGATVAWKQRNDRFKPDDAI